MDKFFNPKTVAVIGVSERSTNLAKNIMINFKDFQFKGKAYPVGPKGGKILGKTIYKSVSDIPDPVELAVILTPADTVPGILKECGKKGIKHAVIMSAGFREYGKKGKEREKKLLEVTRKYGINFVGPNCIGLINFQKGLFTPFLILKDIYRRGGVSIVTQSGGVGITLLYLLAAEGIGISKFASIGNKLDVDENDIIEYLISDRKTDAIIVYLEDISDGRRLMELARRSKKPILLFKANTGKLSQTIASTHTAALSSDDNVVDAALEQAGIARFRDRQTLINYLKILPLPKIKGDKLAILSRSGGHAILATDAAEECGFKLAPFKKSFLEKIEEHVRANVIKLTNPLDLGDVFDYELYNKMIEQTIRQRNVDGLVFMHTSFSEVERKPTCQLIENTFTLSHKYRKPIGVYLATDIEELTILKQLLKQPIFDSPLEIIKAIALARDFDYGMKPKPKLPILKINKKTAETIIKKSILQDRSPNLEENLKLFKSYDIPVIPSHFLKTESEIFIKAEKIGYPVVLKIVSRDISHKTEFGGVAIGLQTKKELSNALVKMKRNAKKAKAEVDGFVLQKMASGGREIIIGAKRDRNFGPIALVGLGGIYAEILKDTAIRVIPFSRTMAHQMIKDLKGYPLLSGARSREKYDIHEIVKVIMRVSKLINDHPEISEIDINPFFVLPEGKGGYALDARIILG